jgi:ArsR family transcriptional regulator
MAKRDAVSRFAVAAAALSDPTRLRLLCLVRDREICVCYLVEVLHMSQPKISRHLAYLRRAGLVESRREGRWMHYGLEEPADAGIANLLTSTFDSLSKSPQMLADAAMLERICRAPQKFVSIAGAPAPAVRTANGCCWT